MIQIKRIYEAPEAEDGYRVLVDRLWPRGLSKEEAAIDEWMRTVAPSNELRQWFDHDESKWESFKKKYREELSANEEYFKKLQSIYDEHEKIMLLYAAKNQNYNNAKALKDILQKEIKNS